MASFWELPFQGKVTFVGRVDEENAIPSRSLERVWLGFDGPSGDRHSGLTRRSCVRVASLYRRGTTIRNTRQISVVSVEDLDEIARDMRLDRIEPSRLGANICLEGIPHLSLLPPSTRLVFQTGATIVVDLENEPCSKTARNLPKGKRSFVIAASGRRGFCAWVEREGWLEQGARVIAHLPTQAGYPHAKTL